MGNETGYLVAMSQDARQEPLVLAPGTGVTLESAYDVADHFGVMGLWFVDLVGFDASCPGTPYSPEGGLPLCCKKSQEGKKEKLPHKIGTKISLLLPLGSA